MKKFEFRLDKVLEFRRLTEQDAKEKFMEARLSTLEGEAEVERVIRERETALQAPCADIEARLELDRFVAASDEREREARIALSVLVSEEELAMEFWKAKRIELKALEGLRERALEEYQLDAARVEQAELDEWTQTRRAA